ncbi:MAG: hypothetical protein EOP84_08385 [Verrucomicrobiaceae bacterium]|nr:MAG: hypothetical protein EOP84_08385 [Verrucomicrobiaceae bacterium]
MSSKEVEELVQIAIASMGPFEPPSPDAPNVTLSARHYFELLKNIHDLEEELASERHVAVMKEEGPDWLRSRFELMGFFKPGSMEYAGPFDEPEVILEASHYYVTAFLGQAMSPKPDEGKFLAKRFPGSQIDPAPPVEPVQWPWDEPVPQLTDFDLSSREGRVGFLWALFAHHYRTGLLLAVNHVWASLARPKSVRCQIMAAALKLPGSGKKALTNVLAAFLEETLYGVDFPPLPNLSEFPDANAWTAACNKVWAGIDRKFDLIMDRFEAILDGRDPSDTPSASAEAGSQSSVVVGPWIATVLDRRRKPDETCVTVAADMR